MSIPLIAEAVNIVLIVTVLHFWMMKTVHSKNIKCLTSWNFASASV